MKTLITLAGAAAGLMTVQNAPAIEPDAHATLWADCNPSFESDDFLLARFDRTVCELSRSFPYDSVGCFLNAWRDNDEEEATEEDDVELDAEADSEVTVES